MRKYNVLRLITERIKFILLLVTVCVISDAGLLAFKTLGASVKCIGRESLELIKAFTLVFSTRCVCISYLCAPTLVTVFCVVVLSNI